jgi:alpha-galactosidase
LLDFGNADAREWAFQMMKQFIDESQVKWIRWDFNTAPLGVWTQMDAPEQRGLAQIRHIMGLYDLLDRLLKAYPDLLIEGCASGGRRIDLETIRRSHTLWKSDETANLRVLRFHQTGGNIFLPGVLLNVNLLPERLPYDIASIFGGPLGFRCNWLNLSVEQRTQIRKQIAAWRLVRSLLNDEYYPLFPQRRDEFDWIGWQFYTPALGEGYFVVLRPEESHYLSASVSLRGLDAEATYTLTPMEGTPGQLCKLTGRQLAQGWTIEMATVGAAQVWRYAKEK